MADPTADRAGDPGPGDVERTTPLRAAAPGLIERVWHGPTGLTVRLLGAALSPAELAFRGVVAVRDVAYRSGLVPSRGAAAPTISVGNLTVGGTGKTPMVRWLTEQLVAGGRTPGILHGGYAEDEPALLRRWFPTLPVLVDPYRVRAARDAVARGADVLLLDDGFQHRRLRRDLDIVLVGAEGWTERPRLLPRGPYREPLAALARADLVVVTRRTAGPDAAMDVARAAEEISGRPTAVAHLRAGAWLSGDGHARPGRPADGAVAVAGIGRPDAFFRQAADTGAELAATLAFRDHHDYTPDDAAAIRARGGPVITTAKDAIKLAPLLDDADLWVLDLEVAFEAGRDTLLARIDATAP